ncbi:MAG TPA: hypothetical protein VEH76_03690 [Methylocystis sp.]|nr:hypothetical protein [Methylocystis sp.]
MKTSLILIAAILGVLAGKIAFVAPAAGSLAERSSVEARCFEALVELDEGYGVTARETRLVCQKAG